MGLPPVSYGPYTFEVQPYRGPPNQRLMLRSYALVQPVPGRSQLQLSEQGLQILREVAGPVAPIVVIGPYRSGKSFLLNQLLGVKCSKCRLNLAGLQQCWQCFNASCLPPSADAGFGVGHTRETETKGIWIWGQSQIVNEGTDKQLTVSGTTLQA